MSFIIIVINYFGSYLYFPFFIFTLIIMIITILIINFFFIIFISLTFLLEDRFGAISNFSIFNYENLEAFLYTYQLRYFYIHPFIKLEGLHSLNHLKTALLYEQVGKIRTIFYPLHLLIIFNVILIVFNMSLS